MHIVADRGTDLAPEQLAGLDIHFVPLVLTLDGVSYRSSELFDLSPETGYTGLTLMKGASGMTRLLLKEEILGAAHS